MVVKTATFSSEIHIKKNCYLKQYVYFLVADFIIVL